MLVFSFVFLAGAKAFVCDQCGAQFSKEDALETHRQTHTGMLTFLFFLLNSFSKQTVQEEAVCLLPPTQGSEAFLESFSRPRYFSHRQLLCLREELIPCPTTLPLGKQQSKSTAVFLA